MGDEKNWVEEEQLYSRTYEKEITEPFNPKDVDIVSQPMVVSNIVDQLKYGDISETSRFMESYAAEQAD